MTLKKITVGASLQYTYLWLKVVNSLQLKMTTVYYVTHVRQVGLNIYHIYLKGWWAEKSNFPWAFDI